MPGHRVPRSRRGRRVTTGKNFYEKCIVQNCISLLRLNCLKKPTCLSAAGASADAQKKNSREKIKIELAWSLCNQGKYLGDLLL